MRNPITRVNLNYQLKQTQIENCNSQTVKSDFDPRIIVTQEGMSRIIRFFQKFLEYYL